MTADEREKLIEAIYDRSIGYDRNDHELRRLCVLVENELARQAADSEKDAAVIRKMESEIKRLASENAELRTTIDMLDNLNNITSFWRRRQEEKAGRDG